MSNHEVVNPESSHEPRVAPSNASSGPAKWRTSTDLFGHGSDQMDKTVKTNGRIEP